jgi:hypothetical protein
MNELIPGAQRGDLVVRPESLMRPGVALRVLRANLHPAAGTRGRPAHPDVVQPAQT